MLLVSLLLVFGLAATAPIIFASTGVVLAGTNNTNYFIRNEGDAEATGTISLSTTSTGTIKSGSTIVISYNAPIANTGGSTPLFAVGITCIGDFGAAICASGVQTAWSVDTTHKILTLPINTDVILTTPTAGTQINVAVRVMAQGLAYNAEVIATVRTTYLYSTFPLTIAPLYPAPYELAQVGPGPATVATFKEGPAHVLTCIGAKDIDYYDNDFALRLTESWPNALTSFSDEYNLENDSVVPAPSNGSNILITLSGIPDGMGVVTKDPYSCAEYPSGPHGCPGGLLNISYVSNSGISGGVESFYYVVNTTNINVIENAVFDFKFWSQGPLPPNQSFQITAQIDLVDGSPSTAPDEMPYFTASEVTGLAVVDFSDCVTKLLFPYINAYQGPGSAPFSHFGTGIDFANTTWDPFALTATGGAYIYPDEAKGSAVPQSGSCTVYLYPANEGTTQVVTTPPISAGGSYAFDVATAAPKFAGSTGYAIAVCNFQNAYGFAEIYDNFGGPVGTAAPGATLGYLAYIIPDPAFYHRSPAGDALGESAIAPINLDKLWRKLFMYGSPYISAP
jgi:hypothetical protein